LKFSFIVKLRRIGHIDIPAGAPQVRNCCLLSSYAQWAAFDMSGPLNQFCRPALRVRLMRTWEEHRFPAYIRKMAAS